MSIEQTDYCKTRFIAGDWGTSNLRLYLCERKNDRVNVIDTRFGAGVSEVNGDFEERFFNLTQDWIDANPTISVILSGMVGSTIGWKEAPYLTCPVNTANIASGRLNFTARSTEFSILAGLKTTNPLDAPDVMRGEELQLLGWMRAQGGSCSGKILFALPGTHNKWALAQDGQIDNFLTAFTGELFSLLRNNSILISEQSAFSFNEAEFIKGVNAIKQLNGAQLVHALFTTRAKQVLGEIAKEDALSYLSGLIIGADVEGALHTFQEFDNIVVIGETMLTQRYQLALRQFGQNSHDCDPSQIASSGYEAVFSEILAADVA